MVRLLPIMLLGISLLTINCLSAQAIGEGKYMLSRLSIKHREHKGMGYDQGYSTAALFICPKMAVLGLPFVDGRLHVFNNEDLAANLGLGARFSDRNHKCLFGLNTYYDYRNVKWLTTHQLSCGMEILSQHLDFRLNGYYPFSGTYQDDPIVFNGFRGHHLMVKHKVRYALPSADAELGWTLPDPFDEVGLYLGVGYYYLFKQKGFNKTVGNVPGVKARLTASPSPYLSFGAEYTYDQLFHGRANGFIALNIPLGRNRSNMISKKRRGKEKTTWLKVQSQDVVRNEIIPIVRKTHRFNHLNGEGTPLHFVFVDNRGLRSDGVASGEGTFEHPYTTLARGHEQTREQDVLYVFAGDGSSKGYDEGLILNSGTTLTSSGVEFDINGVKIPALTPHMLPVITSRGGPVIHVLAPGAVIHGFQIEGREGHAVYVEGVEVTLTRNEIIAAENFSAFKAQGIQERREASHIQGNLFVGQGGSAVIELSDPSGVYVVSENQIFAAAGQQGILIHDPQGATHLTWNRFIATDPEGVAIRYQIGEGGKQGEHSCHHNHVMSGFYEALRIDGETEAQTFFDVHDNKFVSETLGRGIGYTSASHHGSLSIMNNVISSSQEGIYIRDGDQSATAIEIGNNRLWCYSGTPSISSVFSGMIDVTIEENRIEYIHDVGGKFSGISAHLKGHEGVGSKLVILRNTIDMPASNNPVTVINERSAEVIIDCMEYPARSKLD